MKAVWSTKGVYGEQGFDLNYSCNYFTILTQVTDRIKYDMLPYHESCTVHRIKYHH